MNLELSSLVEKRGGKSDKFEGDLVKLALQNQTRCDAHLHLSDKCMLYSSRRQRTECPNRLS